MEKDVTWSELDSFSISFARASVLLSIILFFPENCEVDSFVNITNFENPSRLRLESQSDLVFFQKKYNEFRTFVGLLMFCWPIRHIGDFFVLSAIEIVDASVFDLVLICKINCPQFA